MFHFVLKEILDAIFVFIGFKWLKDKSICFYNA